MNTRSPIIWIRTFARDPGFQLIVRKYHRPVGKKSSLQEKKVKNYYEGNECDLCLISETNMKYRINSI